MSIYREPLYYELAFSFVKPAKQIDLFEKLIKKYSALKAKSFLDMGCGPSPQLLELAKRGYACTGTDLCQDMLAYLVKKAKDKNLTIKTKKTDFTDFISKEKYDFAMMMMGTIGYIDSGKKLLSHLKSVGKCLNPGGLYLIENFRTTRSREHLFSPQTWLVKRKYLTIRVFYKIDIKDRLQGLETETILLEVEDHGKKYLFKQQASIKIFSPLEFLEAIKESKMFDFLGWFNRETLRSLEKPKIGNYTLLRRKL